MKRIGMGGDNLMLAAAAAAGVIMVMLPQQAAEGAKTAIYIWLNSVVPSLLPFFILSDYIRSFGVADRLPLKTYGFVSGVLCGYPMGAKVAAALVEDGVVSKEEGRRLLALILVTGPAFVLGAASDMLGSAAASRIILVSHYLAALINGYFYGVFKIHERGTPQWEKTLKAKMLNPKVRSFSKSAAGGLYAMGMILAYLMLFMIGIRLIEYFGVFDRAGNEAAEALLKGLLEMTIGISCLGQCEASLEVVSTLGAFIISFGGLSVICQAGFLLTDTGIAIIDVVKIKFTHGIIAAFLAIIICRFVL